MNINKKIEIKITHVLREHFLILLILILGLTPLIWFKEGLIIAGGDNFFYLDPSTNLKDAANAWMGKINNGEPSIIQPLIFPFMFFWWSLKSIGFSLINIERFWTILLFVLPGLSIYYLVTHIDSEHSEGRKKLRGFIAAILYMFNVYLMTDALSPTFRPLQAALPILLYFCIKGLNQETFSLKYPALIGLISLFIASSFVNPATVAFILIVFFIYWIFFLITNVSRVIHSLKIVSSTIILFFLMNLWWISTLFISMIDVGSSTKQAVSGVNFTGSTSILEAFRLMGFWAFRTGFAEVSRPLIPYAHAYYEPLIVFLTYSIPIIVFMAILLKPKNKFVIFFSILAVIGLFLAKGVNEPLGFVYKFFYENVPGFWIFREPFGKFTPITLFSYSVLLGYSVEEIYSRISGWNLLKKNHPAIKPAFVPVLVILIILIAAFPLITGKVIQDSSWYGKSIFSLKVEVPEYWHDIGKWLTENADDGRILLLPKAGYGHCYNWKSGMCTGDPVARVLLPTPIIRYPGAILSQKDLLLDKLYSAIGPNSITNIAPFFGLFNVKYVLQQNDLDWQYGLFSGSYSPEDMKKFLNNQSGIDFKKSFGMLDLYQVKEEYFLPHIYVPKEVTYSSGNDSIVDILSSQGFEIKNAIFTADNLDEEQKQAILEDAENIYVKVNPTNFQEKRLEYLFETPKDYNYELYLKTSEIEYDLKNITLWLNGNKIHLKGDLQPNPHGYTRLTDLYFTKGTHKLTINLSEYAYIKVVTFGDEWKFIADDGNVALYQTFLPDSFPESLDTSPSKRGLVMIYRDGVLLKKGGFGENLKESDSISIGEIWPRRVAVSVPNGTKPTGNYSIVYLQGKDEKLGSTSDSVAVILKAKTYEKTSQPKINFKKINAAKYEVSVMNATAPFFIIFSESYHPKWKAYIDKDEVPEKYHLLVNGYANAWYIDPKEAGKEDFTITIYFKPQSYLYIGWIISGLTFIGCIGYLIYNQKNTKRNCKNKAW